MPWARGGRNRSLPCGLSLSEIAVGVFEGVRTPGELVTLETGEEGIEPAQLGVEQHLLAFELDENLRRPLAVSRVGEPVAVCRARIDEGQPADAEALDHLVALEIVRLGERDAEVTRPVDA